LPQTPGAHHERLAFAATKIIEQTGFAHLRSRLTFDGSDRNSAACVAMNASRGFPPYSRCHWISVRSPASVSSKRVLAGADCLKKLRSAFAGELVCRGLAEAGVDVRIGVTVTG
jgi:hypothetical protein